MHPTVSQRLSAEADRSDHAGPGLTFIAACEQILSDNKTPFFPAYTDHGISHISQVLETIELLIPSEAWNENHVKPDDAVTLRCATYLHDLGLHLREPGFLALIDSNVIRPLPWFRGPQSGRAPDAPWSDLWADYRKEVARFSQSQMDRILGPDYGELPRILLDEVPADISTWTTNDRLVIGEFLRRHHARLAHEIAVYGFPGLTAADFPVLSQTMPSLADPIGAVARSHGEDLRVMALYLESRSPGDLRPDGLAQLYLMSLLRIADYFQMQPGRATPLLLHLREPQSPTSVDEWRKHQAVASISWDHRDPHAVSVQVSPNQTLRTHLQLDELLSNLQEELDSTNAVLSETYGASDLSDLHLELQRVRTNLFEPDLLGRLSFVPRRARLRSAEDLFRLVISDLYGNVPAVAGRELLQNSIDAVRELDRWVDDHEPGTVIETRDLPADVLIEVRDLNEETGLLRVSDKGIGMKPSTVIENFLTAGATFSDSSDSRQRLDPTHAIRWLRAGRFGIGVFAAFLLGPQVQVTTRHPAEPRGVTFLARIDDELIQLDWVDEVPVGTDISIEFAKNGIGMKGDDQDLNGFRRLLLQISEFYGLVDPSVGLRIVDRDGHLIDPPFEGPRQSLIVPRGDDNVPDDWAEIDAPDFDGVYWKVPSEPGLHSNRLCHNGLFIEKEAGTASRAYRWSNRWTKKLIAPPTIAVFDSRQRLKISLNRYEMVDRNLPFEDELLGSIGIEIVAHALTHEPVQFPLGIDWGLRPVMSIDGWFPFLPQLASKYIQRDLCVLWTTDPEGPAAKLFLSRDIDTESWEHFPFRIALAPRLPPNRAKRLSPEDILSTINSLRSLVPLNAIATVLPGRDQRSPESEVFSHSRLSGKLRSALTELGENLSTWQVDKNLAITALRPRKQADRKLADPLGECWERAVSGLLNRDADGLQVRVQAISSSNHDVRTRVESWRRRLGIDDN